MVERKDFATPVFPTWCPGCGNFGIWGALKNALVELDWKPEEVLIVYGIGCSGNGADFLKTYGFHGLHGRTLPVATGAKLSNHELKVVAVAGDGDGYGIGVGHFIHAMRRNLDITLIAHNNQVYGLTTGQTSPTSDKGFATKSTPAGVIELPVNPIALALSSGATFISRGFAGDIKYLTNLLVDALSHKGFSLIDIFQPCVTFNNLNTYDWFRDRVYKLEAENHNPQDKPEAFNKSQEWGDKIPIGLFYKERRSTYEDELPQIAEKPLVQHDIENIDISSLLDNFI
ncbi:MAG TPA: thiamine pyrophosphate-dependent enzyme [Candidatus Subteraquimicrobiales bacterium]